MALAARSGCRYARKVPGRTLRSEPESICENFDEAVITGMPCKTHWQVFFLLLPWTDIPPLVFVEIRFSAKGFEDHEIWGSNIP